MVNRRIFFKDTTSSNCVEAKVIKGNGFLVLNIGSPDDPNKSNSIHFNKDTAKAFIDEIMLQYNQAEELNKK